jgi:selenide,water dikinase
MQTKYVNTLKEVQATIKLTQYSHGAGCGCKISPKVLSEMLKTNLPPANDERLLVGNSTRDDAAVYDMKNGTAIISTTDFFMPIVDDPFTFGKIAAVNAISDVYAMGGTPLLAIAILGWPIDKLGPEVAQQVLEGGRQACKEAGIVLAGGHSIDSPEPIFGLAVTGSVDVKQLKQNDTAELGCKLYLTKPLGVGILSTAQKKGILRDEDAHRAPESMTQLNTIGKELAKIEGVKAMTDVTGFGLLGHLTEMCDGSDLSATVDFAKVPKIDNLDWYLEQRSIPGGTTRNWDSYGHGISLSDEAQKNLLCDPQTSGGLLIAVSPDSQKEVEQLLEENEMNSISFGQLIPKGEYLITVN